jgi:hypothetical protein
MVGCVLCTGRQFSRLNGFNRQTKVKTGKSSDGMTCEKKSDTEGGE